jgi:hypothetical protein
MTPATDCQAREAPVAGVSNGARARCGDGIAEPLTDKRRVLRADPDRAGLGPRQTVQSGDFFRGALTAFDRAVHVPLPLAARVIAGEDDAAKSA